MRSVTLERKKEIMKESIKVARLGKPRRKAVPLWRRRFVIMSSIMIMFVGIGVGLWWSVSNNLLNKISEQIRWRAIVMSAEVGFRVNEILVIGRKETTAEVLRKAITLKRGAPILAFDLIAARTRVESLPWVRSATVERMLPDTILLSIEERKPLAIWQHKGKFALIDEQGEVILRQGIGRFNDLLIVVGENAPVQTAQLLTTLKTQPALRSLVKAAVWVGGRRWNLRLTGDIDVRLPESDPIAAWRRLAEYEKIHRVLDHDVQILDLRIPDRLIVRKSTQKKTSKTQTGRET
jgi:cell division protein FtsQ